MAAFANDKIVYKENVLTESSVSTVATFFSTYEKKKPKITDGRWWHEMKIDNKHCKILTLDIKEKLYTIAGVE